MDEISKKEELFVRKSNDLINARYKLTLEEQRLILLLAARINQQDEDFKSYEIRVTDFVQMYGLEKRKAIYTELEESSKRLTGKTIELSRDGKKIYASWLSYVEYVEGSGIIKVEFHKSLKPYLLQLGERFTKYRLDAVMKFKSSYSIRLYELLKMEVWKAEKAHKTQFQKQFSLDEYRTLLGIDKKAYPVFANFRVRVLEPSINEITTQTELKNINIEYIKTGRKITGIVFEVTFDLATRQTPTALSPAPEAITTNASPSVVQQLVDLGFQAMLAEFYYDSYGEERIQRNIAYMLAKQQQGLVNDFPAYLNKAIKEDLGKTWEAEQAKQATEQAQRKITLGQREQQLALLEEQSKRENDRRMQAMLKERNLDTSFDQDELSLMLEQMTGVRVQYG